MSSEIPEDVQRAVHDLAARASNFVERAHNGGSWMELQVWLVSMRPNYDLLVELAERGAVNRTARMRIDPARIEQIVATFTVPNTVPEDTRDDRHDQA